MWNTWPHFFWRTAGSRDSWEDWPVRVLAQILREHWDHFLAARALTDETEGLGTASPHNNDNAIPQRRNTHKRFQCYFDSLAGWRELNWWSDLLRSQISTNSARSNGHCLWWGQDHPPVISLEAKERSSASLSTDLRGLRHRWRETRSQN